MTQTGTAATAIQALIDETRARIVELESAPARRIDRDAIFRASVRERALLDALAAVESL